MDTEYSGDEQRQRRQIDNVWQMKVQQHIDQEDAQILQVKETLSKIEADLKPIKNLYFAVIGSAGVGALLLLLLLFIYQSDKTDTKEMRQSLLKQGAAIEQLLIGQQFMSRDISRLETKQDKERP